MEPVNLLCAVLLLSSGALSADVATLGTSCIPGTDICTVNGAVCDKTTKTCVCNDGYVQSGSECARKHSLPCGGGMCTDWRNTVCDSNKCKCDTTKGLVANAGSTACDCPANYMNDAGVCKKVIGQTCGAASECYTGLVCTASKCACDATKNYAVGTDGTVTCACPTNNLPDIGVCKKTIGETCTAASECYTGLVCTASKCACDTTKNLGTGTDTTISCPCATGFQLDNGVCKKTIGQTCSAASECYTGLLCTASKCACDTTKNLGTGADGTVVCPCATGFESDNGVCKKRIGDACSAASECYTGLVCTSSKCACDATKNYAVGTDTQVTCTCATGFQLDNGVCKKRIGDTCSAASECYTGLVCTSSKCACDATKNYAVGTDTQVTCNCPTNNLLDNGVCKKTIGETCAAASDCYTGLVCTGSPAKCACDATKNYGVGTDTQVTCTCATGFQPYNGVCKKAIGQTCTAASECYPDLVCTGSPAKCACDSTKHFGTGTDGQVSCTCATGYTSEYSMCRVSLNQACTRGVDSTPCVYKATCSKETDTCVCDAARGYMLSGSTCGCLPTHTSLLGECWVKLDGYCTSTCVGGATCFGNTTHSPYCKCNSVVNTDYTCSNADGLFASLTSLMAALFVTWRLM